MKIILFPFQELSVKVEALLESQNLKALATYLPPELATLLAHPEVLDPVKLPAGRGTAAMRWKGEACETPKEDRSR